MIHAPCAQELAGVGRCVFWTAVRCKFLRCPVGHESLPQNVNQSSATRQRLRDDGPIRVAIDDYYVVHALVREEVGAYRLERVDGQDGPGGWRGRRWDGDMR